MFKILLETFSVLSPFVCVRTSALKLTWFLRIYLFSSWYQGRKFEKYHWIRHWHELVILFTMSHSRLVTSKFVKTSTSLRHRTKVSGIVHSAQD